MVVAGCHVLTGEVLREVPRLLTAVDRASADREYGCCDRYYWAWRYRDVPDASLQNTLAILAAAWRLPRSDANPYGNSEQVAEWVRAGLRFLRSIQHPDGSFDQVCPNEHSIGATAYTLFGAVRAFRLVSPVMPPGESADVRAMLSRGARFVAASDETYGQVSNHVALYARVLLESSETLDERSLRAPAVELLERLRGWARPEGWLPEYDGADAGYQTQCLAHLARCSTLTHESWIDPLLRMMVSGFLQYAIHPDGSIGGEYGSRSNQVFYPSGFAYLAPTDPVAARVLTFMLDSIANGCTVVLRALDLDNAIRLALDYIDATEYPVAPVARPGVLPFERDDVSHALPDAQLMFRSTPRYYAVIGAGKGGVLKVFDKTSRRIVCNDGGCVSTLDDGTIVTSQYAQRAEVETSGSGVRIVARFFKVPAAINTPPRLMAFRLLNLTVMRIPALAELVKQRIARMLITGWRAACGEVERSITFGPDAVTVEDRVSGLDAGALQRCRCGGAFAFPRMAAGHAFQPGQLEPAAGRATEQRSTGVLVRRLVVQLR